MFSVIIPTKNRPHFLQKAIASALAQSVPAIQVVVTDDGDGSGRGLVATMRDPRVIALDNRGRGPVPARNLAVASATYPLLAFLDDDDWWQDPSHLARAYASIAEGADFWFSNGDMVFDNGRSEAIPFEFIADALTLERDNTILISAVVYRRSLHDSLGAFDEALPYYWDWDWYLRVARSGARLQHDPSRSVAIRCHDSNMSGPSTAPERAANLAALAAKHGIGPLVLKDHLSLARAESARK